MKRLISDIKMFIKITRHIETLCPGLMVLGIVRNIFNALHPFINIYMSARIVDMLLSSTDYKATLKLAIITVLLNFVTMLITHLLNRITGVRQTVFYNNYEGSKKFKVAELDYDLVDNVETQKTLNRIFQHERMNGGGIRGFYHASLSLVNHTFTIIFSVSLTLELFIANYNNNLTGIAKYISTPYFAVFILAFCAFSVWFGSYSNIKSTRYQQNAFKRFTFVNQFSSAISNAMTGNIGGMYVRIYNQRALLFNANEMLFNSTYNSLHDMSKYAIKHAVLPISIIECIMQIILYAFASLGALAGRFTVGSIARYISSILKFTDAIRLFITTFEELRFNNEITKVYFDFIETPSHMYQGTLPVEKRDDRDYHVEFCNVSFKYPNTDFYALKNVNFKFKIGEKLAVVGMNGSGKTTMIKLMCRLYDPTEGQIFLNGINIRKYDYREYMSIFSVVFQDFNLFAFTLGQNVATDLEYDKKRAIESLNMAGFGERLCTLENGLDTYLYRKFEETGVEISGGEAQKIALARALYKNAPFIILDEPTSALDPIAEAEVYRSFNNIVGDRTAIYISHRLSSCRFCDKILVIDNGSIAQFGTHDELILDEHGKYHELWNAQAGYYQTPESQTTA